MNEETRIHAITQSVIAVLVVIGGGIMLVFTPDNRGEITGLVGVVIGYYFNQVSSNRSFTQWTQALEKGKISNG